MARDTGTPVADASETEEEIWEEISVGLGTEHNPEENGPLTAIFIESTSVDVNDKVTQEVRPTLAHIFDVAGVKTFIWGSYNLDLAMQEVSVGDKVRITFAGRNNFQGEKGPQQVKNYRVQVAKRS